MGLLLVGLLSACFGVSSAGASDQSAEVRAAQVRAAEALASEVLATLEVAAAHCPQIRAHEDVRDCIVEASGRDETALRESEAYLQQMLKLNPLIENYDHQTGCLMLSRSHEGDAPGMLSIE